MFVLASSMVDSVPRGRARTKSRLVRSTLWGATLNCIGIQPRAAGVPGRHTGTGSSSPRCLFTGSKPLCVRLPPVFDLKNSVGRACRAKR